MALKATATAMEPTAIRLTATAPTAPTRRPSFGNLGHLVGEAATDLFLQNYFGRDAFRRRLPVDEALRLFNWDVLNRAIVEHRLGPPRLKLEKDGREVGRSLFHERRPRPSLTLYDIDVPALYEQLRDGATLILDAVNELHAPLRELSAGLAQEFGASSQTNLYACWGQSQGFDIHWDDHDVFVVQLDGAKRWDLYGFTRAAPLRGEREPAPKPDHAPEQIVLEAGDILYLPRGYWHAAVGLGGPSLHLTIGLSRKSGADFLRWVADEAVADATVRADLRLEADDAVLGAQLAELLRSQLAASDPTELGRRYRRHLQAAARHRPEMSLPHIGRPEDLIAQHSRLRLTGGATALEPGSDSSQVRFHHRGTVYTLAAETGPVLAALMAGEHVTYADFVSRARPAPERLLQAFARDMLRKGVFAIEPEG